MICGTHDLSGPIGSDDLFLADSNLVVRAAAGSGKTTVLVARMTALIRSGVAPESIVAITFTRKAAGEMRGRFFSHLRDAIRTISGILDTIPDESSDVQSLVHERELLRYALSVIDQIFIDTIHAFCQRILSERPFLVGLPADFSVIDPLDEERMSAVCWRRFLDAQTNSAAERMQSLATNGIHLPDLYDYFRVRSGLHGLPIGTESSEKPDASTALSVTEEFLDHLLRYVPGAGKRDPLMLTLERADRFRKSISLDTDAVIVEWLRLFDNLVSPSGSLKSGLITLNRWSPDKKSEAYRFAQSLKGSAKLGESTLVHFILLHIRPVVQAWREHIYPEIEEIVHDAVDAYFTYRVSEGRLVFRDLLQLCVRLFRTSESARVHFSSRFGRILVDEFQDTDPLQAELLFLLTAKNTKETDWRACKPRPGSLMIVGDDKQAIYRFRGADVRVFSICEKLIRQSDGRVLNLTSNFRSTPSLCAWINNALMESFGQDGATYQAVYEPLSAARSETGPVKSVCTLSIPRQRGHLSESIARLEAGKIVSIIREMTGKDGSRDYGDFLLLTRVSNRMHLFIDALRQSGIPFETAGSRSLHRAVSLRTILHLLNVVRNPSDSVSLIAYLRGPLCGFSDKMLVDFRSMTGAIDLRLPVPSETDDALAYAVTTARALVESSRLALIRWPVAQAMEHILMTTGLLAAYAQEDAGSTEAGALEKVLVLLRTWESAGMNWLEARQELLRLSRGELDQEGLTLESGQGRAVRIFNIHQAKGLEADVVFLVDADPSVRAREPQFFVERREGGARVIVPVRKKAGFREQPIAEPTSWTNAMEEEKRFSAAEDNRLRYVAATRAREQLFITRYMGSDEKGFWAPFYDHLPLEADGDDLNPLEDEAGNCHSDASRDESSFNDAFENLRINRERMEAGRVPTWQLIRPSKPEVESVGSSTIDESYRGRGRGYGRAVHRLFEYAIEQHLLGKPMDDARWCSYYLQEEIEGSNGRDLSDLEGSAIRALCDFRKSEIWHSVCDSDECYTELPFTHSLKNTEPVQVVSGIMDLVFRVGPQWTIVDYKTDARTERSLLTHYAGQLQAYIDSWQHLTGATSIRAGLWSVQESTFMPVE